uniref:Putative secreted protein n=1 Tax=Ixodes ricinus TaxID=34613 RepID=A0A6B0TXP0_IXORI
MNLGCWLWEVTSFSVKVLSVALGNMHSSSSRARMPMGFSIRSMVGCRSRPKSMNFHSMPSRRYSSCSSTNMVLLKSCCSFSLV